MIYTLKKDNLELTIDSFGAQITSLKLDGKEKLWQNDNGSWDGHAPLLFPVCGHCRIIVDGKDSKTPPHGFAINSEFNFKEQGEDFISFYIVSDENTKKVYPFEFKYVITYKIKDNRLDLIHEVENPSKENIYFALGGHETFALDKDLQNYRIDFEKEEQPIWWKERGIYVKPAKKPYKLTDGKILPFPHKYISGVRTLIFGNIKSDKLWLKTLNGDLLAEVGFKGFENVLFWRSKRAKMICIEPWSNLPDQKNDFTEVDKKFGFFKVEPEKTVKVERYIKYYNV